LEEAVSQTSPVTETLEQWIDRNFAGHGRALRTLREPPIDGEPFMSMEDAKQLLRDGIAQFTAGRAQTAQQPVAWQMRPRGSFWQHCDIVTDDPDIEFRPLYAAPEPTAQDCIVTDEMIELAEAAFYEQQEGPLNFTAGMRAAITAALSDTSTLCSPPAATTGDIPSGSRPPASAAMGHSAGGEAVSSPVGWGGHLPGGRRIEP
jgi:hypothetical protein